MHSITFVLFTYNEEKRLSYVLRNFRQYGPVLILDGGSTDGTERIAREHGATFLRRTTTTKPFVENQENLELIKKHTETDWIYWGYCDNIAPTSLLDKLISIAEQQRYKKVNIPLYTYLWGETRYVAQKSYIPSFFHKNYMDFSNNYIHEFGHFTGSKDQELTLPSVEALALRHFSTYTQEKFVTGYMRYAEEEAQQKFKRGERFRAWKLIGAFVRYAWIYRRALRRPRLGLVIICNMAFGRLMTYARLYELEHDISIETEEAAYAKKKEELLGDV